MLLIGQDYPDALVPLATMPGAKGEPYAIKTRLGWTVNGPVTASETQVEQQVFFTQREWYEQLNQKLERFRKLESSGLYEDEKRCLHRTSWWLRGGKRRAYTTMETAPSRFPFDTRSHGHQITRGWRRRAWIQCLRSWRRMRGWARSLWRACETRMEVWAPRTQRIKSSRYCANS